MPIATKCIYSDITCASWEAFGVAVPLCYYGAVSKDQQPFAVLCFVKDVLSFTLAEFFFILGACTQGNGKAMTLGGGYVEEYEPNI